MKNMMNKTMLALMLALALTIGAMAIAETVPAEPPTLEAEAPAEETAPADNSDATRAAMDALREARKAKAQAEFEEELQGYVADGTLTQEQADLILNEYKTRDEQRANGKSRGRGMKGGNGCQDFGMNGGMNRGMNRGMGGRMNGGMGRGMMAQTAPEMPEAPAMDGGI